MKKRDKIIYWIATVWLAFGMIYTGVIQLMHHELEVTLFTKLGYPLYLLTILGVWKILGSIAVLMPKSALIKEWAYAGFFFAMSGAFASHIANGDPANELIGPTLLLVLTVVSWYFRPADKKVILVNQ